MRARTIGGWSGALVALAALAACADESDPDAGGDDGGATATDGADGAADDGDDGDDGDGDGDGDGTDPDVTVGGFTISGVARTWPDEALLADACVAWLDPAPLASGGVPTVSSAVSVDSAGAFSLSDVPRASSLGLFLVVDDCDDLADGLAEAPARGGDLAPTAILLSADRWGPLGPDDTLDGVTARALPQAERARLEAEHAAARAHFNTDEGMIFGRILDIDLAPVNDGRIRGTSGVQVLYQQTPGTWEGWAQTAAAGDGLYAVPAPAWSSWICFSPAGDYEPVIMGAMPGVMVHRDCVPVVPR